SRVFFARATEAKPIPRKISRNVAKLAKIMAPFLPRRPGDQLLSRTSHMSATTPAMAMTNGQTIEDRGRR
ncbi:MAG TPA: hypothetical protein VLN73_08180, partial [Alphaproteobacteria bacterium]|nr:hypothetical protein [Alphaproteobacteria bacterium]